MGNSYSLRVRSISHCAVADGCAAIQDLLSGLFAAFPDLHVENQLRSFSNRDLETYLWRMLEIRV